MTNGDKIRQMSDKQLLDFMCDFENCACDFCTREKYDCQSMCSDGYAEWLESEAKE